MAELAPVDDLTAQAADIAAKNPPLRVLATIVLGVFMCVGFVVGRTWLAVAKSVAFVGLSVRYGYRKGAKVPVAAKGSQPQQQ